VVTAPTLPTDVGFSLSLRAVLANPDLYHPAPRLTAACAAPAAGVPSARVASLRLASAGALFVDVLGARISLYR
jgi:hypothetical protein